jgi:hemoglobin/transferrin/lactoferrin receptor protein
MKLFYLIIIICFFTLNNFAQTTNVQIKIFDKSDNKPITNANIQLSQSYFGTSNSNGISTIKDVKKGAYQLIITHINYKEFTSGISVFSDTTITIKLNPSAIKLSDVIVTAGKYEQDVNYVPYSISVVNKMELQSSPALTIPDILKTESGISIIRDGIWGTEVSIRGLNRANVVTLIDGDRIETATDLSARLSMIDLNDVERIEIIKGAASALYGSGAVGGVINIISKTGSYKNKLSINGNYYGGLSSVNNFYSNGINLFAADKNWIAKLSGAFRKAGNTKTPQGILSNSQFEDNSISALLRYKLLDNHEIKVDFQQFRATNVGIPGGSTLFPSNAVVTYPEETRRLYDIQYKITDLSKSFLKLSLKYFHQYISRDVKNVPGIVQYIQASNGSPLRRVSVLDISPSADHNIDGFQAQSDFSFSNHYLIAGFDFWKRNYIGIRSKNQKIEALNSTDSSVVNTIYKSIYDKPLPDANFNSAGVYLQDEIKLLDKIDVTVGGRYDFIWLHNSKTLSPLYEINNGVVNNNPAGQFVIWDAQSVHNKSYVLNLGLVYSITSTFNFALNAANSFRSPSLEERYQYIDLGNLVRVGDPNLKPENGYFFDFGIRYFPENINFHSSLFYNSFTNLVSEEPGIYEGRNALIKTNIGKAYLFGFDYSLSFYLLKELEIYNTLSYVRGINKLDNSSLAQIPPLNGIIGLRFEYNRSISANCSLTFFDKQDKIAKGEINTPGYVYSNIGFNFTNIEVYNFTLNFSTGIENIFNKEYRNHLSTNRGLIVCEPGRNFYLKTIIAF